MPKSTILPLAAAVTAVTLAASPALATSTFPGKRDDAKVVAFPLVAVKSQVTANLESHVSHSSHVSGSGAAMSRTPRWSTSHTHPTRLNFVNKRSGTAARTAPSSPVFSSSAVPSFSNEWVSLGRGPVAKRPDGQPRGALAARGPRRNHQRRWLCVHRRGAVWRLETRGIKWLARHGGGRR